MFVHLAVLAKMNALLKQFRKVQIFTLLMQTNVLIVVHVLMFVLLKQLLLNKIEFILIKKTSLPRFFLFFRNTQLSFHS